MQLVIDVDRGDARAMFKAITTRIDEPRDVLELMSIQLNEYEAGLFASGGNGQWAPNDPATIALKGSSTVLIDTGNLLEVMTHAVPGVDGESVVLAGVEYLGYLRGYGRDPAPTPDQSTLSAWSEQLLGFVVDGRL